MMVGQVVDGLAVFVGVCVVGITVGAIDGMMVGQVVDGLAVFVGNCVVGITVGAIDGMLVGQVVDGLAVFVGVCVEGINVIAIEGTAVRGILVGVVSGSKVDGCHFVMVLCIFDGNSISEEVATGDFSECSESKISISFRLASGWKPS
jgi:hypothetical protein